MTFFYSDTTQPGPRPQINVWEMNGTRNYLKHYDNYLFLQFVSTNPRSTDAEKRQARLELTICEKKLEFWRRHPNYDQDEALKGIQDLKRNWSAAA